MAPLFKIRELFGHWVLTWRSVKLIMMLMNRANQEKINQDGTRVLLNPDLTNILMLLYANQVVS